MNSKRKYLVIVGARPNFVKAAPLFRRAKEYPELGFTLLHTGQHFDENMSKIFFDQMGIPKPDIQLDIQGEQFSEKLGKLFSKLKQIVSEGDYDGVVVFGDINSTLAGAIAAASDKVKLIHIESGLRSHDKRMPEELNRVITDHLSDQLFATEQAGVDNLILEGVDEKKVSLVGNIMVESIEVFKDTFDQSTILEELHLSARAYVVATLHRAENTSDKAILKKLLTVLKKITEQYPVVFPLHPGTRQLIASYGLEDLLEGITVTEPIGYLDFMKLVMEAKGVVTDSGGIQEETSHLGIPCCTLRDNTERPVTLTLGTNQLFPIETLQATEVLAHLERTDFVPGKIPLWDGEVSRRILDRL